MIEGVRERETDLPVSPMSGGERASEGEVGLLKQNAIGPRRGIREFYFRGGRNYKNALLSKQYFLG